MTTPKPRTTWPRTPKPPPTRNLAAGPVALPGAAAAAPGRATGPAARFLVGGGFGVLGHVVRGFGVVIRRRRVLLVARIRIPLRDRLVHVHRVFGVLARFACGFVSLEARRRRFRVLRVFGGVLGEVLGVLCLVVLRDVARRGPRLDAAGAHCGDVRVEEAGRKRRRVERVGAVAASSPPEGNLRAGTARIRTEKRQRRFPRRALSRGDDRGDDRAAAAARTRATWPNEKASDARWRSRGDGFSRSSRANIRAKNTSSIAPRGFSSCSVRNATTAGRLFASAVLAREK